MPGAGLGVVSGGTVTVKPKNKGTNSNVQSLSRALGILNVLAEAEEGHALSDLTRQVGLAPSTVHRLLTTLQYERYVRFDGRTGRWKVGIQAFRVGTAFQRARDLGDIARPYMQTLMEESGETANLAIHDQGDMVYLAQVESREMMRALARPGARVHMHCSAIGKAVLAMMDDDEMTEIVTRRGLVRMTDRTIDSLAGLRAELARVRETGYAIDDEEHAAGLRCVAAPIFDEFSRPIAAISLSGPIVRVQRGALAHFGHLVGRAGRHVTEAIGGRYRAAS
ncbi:IclR family transcriptional regulator [Oceanibacterium hippocampi]|uniref:Acetate operon repressor n=1 Tax=Oceanibacterium hippocampi TaxID=745714 RepID=A0A1Y5T8Z4_9PROT|nr:IclR family transcriptional regulator [Oceanibacterium hippocampi]SLN54996.1 Acetate operon repressor [Oceanibacterium hippocampi]